MYHGHTKHIEIDSHVIHEKIIYEYIEINCHVIYENIVYGLIQTMKVNSVTQILDLFTKS